MKTEQALYIEKCTVLIRQNPAKLNLSFLTGFDRSQLISLHEKLIKLSQEGVLPELSKQDLHQLVNPSAQSYFYHGDDLEKSMIFEGDMSPLAKEELLGQGQYGQVHRFSNSTSVVAVKSGHAKQTHLKQEHDMLNQVGLSSHYFFHPSKERLVLPYVKGKTLIHYLRKNILGVSQWLRVCISVAEALMGIHAKGVVHFDLTPYNIMLDEHLKAHLIDFGESVDDVTLKRVDVYAFSNLFLKKFTRLQKQSYHAPMVEVVDMLNATLDASGSTELSDILEVLRTSLINVEAGELMAAVTAESKL